MARWTMRVPLRDLTIGVPIRTAECVPDCGCTLARGAAAAREIIGAEWFPPAAETAALPRCAAANAGIARATMEMIESRWMTERFPMAATYPVSTLRTRMRPAVYRFQPASATQAAGGPLALFPCWGICYNHARRGICREARVGAGRAGACGERIFAVRCQAERAGPAGRCFAILSRLLPAAGIAALQTGLRGMRLLHVLRGLLLISFADRPGCRWNRDG